MQATQPQWCRAYLDTDSVIDGDTLSARLLQGAGLGVTLARTQQDASGRVRLRLLGLDAPETDYGVAPPGFGHQPLAAALAATEALQQALALPASGASVWLCLHGVDRYGRLLTLVYPSCDTSPPVALHLPSVNSALLAAGAVYPDFSAGLPLALLRHLRRASRQARDQQLGVWASDCTRSGFPLQGLGALTRSHLVWPRLFRRVMECARLHSCTAANGEPSLEIGALREFLAVRDGPWLNQVTGEQKNLGQWLEMAGQHCRFPGDVENFLHQPPPGSAKLP